ncbi:MULTISPECIES: hypothetical protein [Brachybacterium]|uniref:hypothetical protein n=1 Tax=Brachybacterium TaxID=43668 RepID=UPI0006B535DA|nr:MULTISPECIES: hypothetical protein [Brachybacterium]GAP79059.1 hypothetical protein Y09_1898 [Brachybacterium sp. SW0106-09]
MLSYLLAPRSTVLDLLAGDDDASVGPESATGWTVAWFEDPDLIEEIRTAILVDEAGEVEIALGVRRDGVTRSWSWAVDEDEKCVDDADGIVEVGDGESLADEDGAARELAAALGAPDEIRSALRELLAQRREPDSFVDRLATLTGLPAPSPPHPVRALVLSRTTPAATRLTGQIAATGLGDIALADLGDGWSGLLMLENPDLGPQLADAVGRFIAAQGLRSRKKRALLLWRGENGAAGFELHRGENLYAAHSWGTGWTDIVSAELSVRDAFAEELLVLAPDAPEHRPRLRSLMRADTRDRDPLAELVDLLDLPSDAIAVLDPGVDGTAAAPWDDPPVPLELLEPAGLGRFLRGLVTGRGLPPLAPRWVLRAYGALCASLSLLSALWAATKTLVVATDGAIVDQPTATAGDWIFLCVAVVATVVNAVIAAGSFLQARAAE